MLFEFLGPSIDDMDEAELMAKICEIAVIQKNTSVHRQEFYNMKQEEGQSAKQFLTKLRAKADHCDFRVSCSSADCNHKSNSYASEMIADILTAGCYDQDIQGELLARSAKVQSLEEKFDLMQALESGKKARQQLTLPSTVAAQRSNYKRSQQQKLQHAHNTSSAKCCQGCGSTQHGPGPTKP